MEAIGKVLKTAKHIHCMAHRNYNCVISSFKSRNFEFITNKISKLVEHINRNTCFFSKFKDYLLDKRIDLAIIKRVTRRMLSQNGIHK